MDKFYEVIAKCGHVGRDKYVEQSFYVRASTRKEAASKIKNIGRVKKHHKDRIIDVTMIDYYEYRRGFDRNNKDPYLTCHSVQEQRDHLSEIAYKIKSEPVKQSYAKSESSRKDIFCNNRKLKNPRKYYRNYYNDIDCSSYESMVS